MNDVDTDAILEKLVYIFSGSHAKLNNRVYDRERFTETPGEYIQLLASLDEDQGGSGDPIGIVLNWAGWTETADNDFKTTCRDRFTGELMIPFNENLPEGKNSWGEFRDIMRAMRRKFRLKANINLGLGVNVRHNLVQADLADAVVTTFGEEGTGARSVHYLPFYIIVETVQSRCISE